MVRTCTIFPKNESTQHIKQGRKPLKICMGTHWSVVIYVCVKKDTDLPLLRRSDDSENTIESKLYGASIHQRSEEQASSTAFNLDLEPPQIPCTVDATIQGKVHKVTADDNMKSMYWNNKLMFFSRRTLCLNNKSR